MGSLGYIKDWFAAMILYLMADLEVAESQGLTWICTGIM